MAPKTVRAGVLAGAFAAALGFITTPAAAQKPSQAQLGASPPVRAEQSAAKTGAAKLAGKVDSAAAPAVDSMAALRETQVSRETFAYSGGARDPSASLINQKSSGPELVDLQLVAIYQDLKTTANSVTVLRDKQSGKRYKLRVGDQIGRMRVAQIRPKDVVFTIEDFGFERQETLSLRKQEDVTP